MRGDLELLEVAERLADRAVQTNTPRRRLPFDLARALRGIPGVDEAVARDPAIILPAVAAWCRILHAHPSDARDISFGEEAHHDVFVQVLAAWRKVRVVGAGTLAVAVGQARRAPLVLLDPLACYGPTFLTIVSTAYHLQRFRGAEDIFLPARQLGLELGIHYTRAADHVALACRHQMIRRTRPAAYAKRQAAGYRFELGSPLYRAPVTDNGDGRGAGRTDEDGADRC